MVRPILNVFGNLCFYASATLDQMSITMRHKDRHAAARRLLWCRWRLYDLGAACSPRTGRKVTP